MDIKIFNIENFLNWYNLIYAAFFLVLSYSYLYFAGFLKTKKKVKTGYTRKIFHILIFLTAAIIDLKSDLVYIFGITASIVGFYAVFRGKGHILYEALARESDAPSQSYYIVVPFLTTILGGLISSTLFAKTAFFGYLVLGIGDAMGEIIGTRFGHHKYNVAYFGNISQRSYEGSLAVFVSSLIVIIIGIVLSPITFNLYFFLTIPGLALACTLIEAWSPHGWDNLTLQIAPSFLILFV